MGSSNGITRGQLRPHFSGRSPPFLLAALCVGLGILGISYWSLSQQYNQLEEQLKKALIRKDSIENDLNFIQSQLSAREEEFSRAKQEIHKNEEQLSSANVDVKTKTEEINAIHSQLDALRQNYDKCKEDLMTKTNQLADAMTKIKDNEQQKQESNQMKDHNQELDDLKSRNQFLEKQLEQLRLQLNLKSETKNETNSVPNQNQNQNPSEVNANNNRPQNESSVNAKDQQNQQNLNPKPLVSNDPIIELIKTNSVPQNNGLAEEDRKEEALVEANIANNDNNDNEVGDDFKPDNKEAEDSKAQPINI